MSVCRSSSFYVWIVPRGICPCKNNFCPCRRPYLVHQVPSISTCYQYGTATTVLLRGSTWKALEKYGFEFKNFTSVVCLLDRYRACFEPLCQKHGLFKIVFSSKKHLFVNGNICKNHLQTRLHFLKLGLNCGFDDVVRGHTWVSFQKMKWFLTVFNWYLMVGRGSIPLWGSFITTLTYIPRSTQWSSG